MSIPTDLHTFPYYELEGVSPQSMAAAADGSTIVTVQGRLKEYSTFWLSNLEASKFVKQIVQFGYRIPFLALPAPIFRLTTSLPCRMKNLFLQQLWNWKMGTVMCLAVSAHLCVNPLSAVQNESGKRSDLKVCQPVPPSSEIQV